MNKDIFLLLGEATSESPRVRAQVYLEKLDDEMKQQFVDRLSKQEIITWLRVPNKQLNRFTKPPQLSVAIITAYCELKVNQKQKVCNERNEKFKKESKVRTKAYERKEADKYFL